MDCFDSNNIFYNACAVFYIPVPRGAPLIMEAASIDLTGNDGASFYK